MLASLGAPQCGDNCVARKGSGEMTLVASPPAEFALPAHIRVDRDQFNRRARARTLERAPTLDQFSLLRERLSQTHQTTRAPWAKALLHAQATQVTDTSQPARQARTGNLAPRWLTYVDTDGASTWLRVSAPFARGGQAALQIAATESGHLLALRTEFFETSQTKPKSLQTTSVHGKQQEHAALTAAHSPLLPVQYLGIKTIHPMQADGSLHALMPLYVADVRELTTCFGSSPTERALVTLQLAIDVGTRLAVLHAARYVHFDVKPNNVLLSPDGHFELADFGCAQPLPDHPVDGSLSGSQMYMSPEALLEGGHDRWVGPASDFFSLGLTLLDVATNFSRLSTSKDAAKELRTGLQSWRDATHGRCAAGIARRLSTSGRTPMGWQQLRAEVSRTSPILRLLLDQLLLPESSARLTGFAFVAQAHRLQRVVARDAMRVEQHQWAERFGWHRHRSAPNDDVVDAWTERQMARWCQLAATRYMMSDACTAKRAAMASVCGMTPRPASA